MRPWTYAEFDARADEYRRARSRRDRSLVGRFGLLIAILLATLALVPRSVPAGTDRWVFGSCTSLAAFGVYVLAGSRGHSRRHAIRCPTCRVSVTQISDWIADAREVGLELPKRVGCPQCGVVIIVSECVDAHR